MGKYVLVIDRGSTNVKAILFDTKGKEAFVSSHPCQKPVSVKPGWWEQDMDQMWEDSVKAVKGLFEQGVSPEEVKGVIVTGQGNGLMPIDKDGNPSRMGMLSLDARAGSIVGDWIADGSYDKIVEVSHMPFGAGSPLPLLAWFKKEQPEEYAKMDKILFSKDWIRYKLSGSLCTDLTDASGASLMDLTKKEYAYDEFEFLGLEDIKDKLPEIHKSHEQVGKVTEEAAKATGLHAGTPVFCGIHDIAAYPFGIGTFDSRQVISVMGTWGMNVIPVKDMTGAPAGLFHSVPDYFLSIIGDGNSGGCFDIMIDNLCQGEKTEAEKKGISVYQYLQEMVEETRPTGIVFQPFLFGHSFCGDAGAGFVGIKNWHTKADIMRAVYEGIVMGHYMNIQAMPDYKDFKCLWLIGGGSKSKIFGQLFADITGLTVKVPCNNEITARGGAMNAWVGLGEYANHEEASILPEIAVEYVPDREMREFYQKKQEVFCRLYEMNKEVWPQLNEMSM